MLKVDDITWLLPANKQKTLSTSGATRLEKQELHFTYNFGPNFEKIG